jgi:hypothetical protein
MFFEDHKCTIKIDGVACDILSYRGMLILEPKNYEGDGGVTPEQYLAILFKNLGYDKYPKDFLWLHNGIDITNVEKTEVMDYPITRSKLMLYDNSTLYDVIVTVWYWCKAGLERGYLMEPSDSFYLPENAEIQHCLQNRIKIKRVATMRESADIWERSNTFLRRYYHAAPGRDGEYFDHCLGSELMEATKMITIDDPYSLFVLGIANIDLFFDMIRTSEIVGTKQAFISYGKKTPIALMSLNQLFPYFNTQIQARAKAISNIYRTVGATGLLTGDREERFLGKYKEIQKSIDPYDISDNIAKTGKKYVPATITGYDVIKEIAYKIAMSTLDESKLAFIYRYVKQGTLKDVDSWGENSIERDLLYKKIYYTLNQIDEFYPGTLDEIKKSRDGQLIFSMEFYIDPDKWALYNPKKNCFYIATDNLYILVASREEAVDYYEFKLGREVWLDGNEMGVENIQSNSIPSYDIFEMEKRALNVNPNPINVTPQLPPPVPSQVLPQSTELYGFNLDNIVTDYRLPD